LREWVAPIMLTLMLLAMAVAAPAAAQLTPELAEVDLAKFFAMALSVAVCGIAAAYAVARVSVAAFAAAAEKPELLGRAIIFAGLAEGIAIYGLLIAFLIWIS